MLIVLASRKPCAWVRLRSLWGLFEREERAIDALRKDFILVATSEQATLAPLTTDTLANGPCLTETAKLPNGELRPVGRQQSTKCALCGRFCRTVRLICGHLAIMQTAGLTAEEDRWKLTPRGASLNQTPLAVLAVRRDVLFIQVQVGKKTMYP